MVVYQLLLVPYLNEVGGMFGYDSVPVTMKVCSVLVLRNKHGYYH